MSSLPVAPESSRFRSSSRPRIWGTVATVCALGMLSAPARAEQFDRLLPERPTYHLFAGVSVGRGIRFQNPYRLPTELGSDARSLSLTANYLDLHFGATMGSSGPVSHGVAVYTSIALDGIPQEVVTPNYVLLWRVAPRWAVAGRAGIPIVVEPDLNAGFEVAGEGIFYVTSSVGITFSTVGSLFYGAATLESSRTAIPILSFEGGLIYDFEVLP